MVQNFSKVGKMLTLEQIKKKLEDRNISCVAERTGLSYYTVRRARSGADISYSAATKLSEYLAA